jgi:hypothetical protein
MTQRFDERSRHWLMTAGLLQLCLGLPAQAADEKTRSTTPPSGRVADSQRFAPSEAAPLPTVGAGSAATWRGPVKAAPGAVGAAVTADRPDLTSLVNPVVAGKYTVPWGKGLTLSDADAGSASNGVCQITIAHAIRNAGTAPSSGFARLWRNLTQKGVLEVATPSMAAGSTLALTDTLGLKPGVNNVVLYLDYFDEVKEKVETNNQHGLSITVSGKCGGVPAESSARSGVDGLRWAPENAPRGTQSPTVRRVAPASALPAQRP